MPSILALNVSTAAHVDVLEIQLPKLGNRVSGKRMHPHAPQTRVRKYVCEAIRSPVDAPVQIGFPHRYVALVFYSIAKETRRREIRGPYQAK